MVQQVTYRDVVRSYADLLRQGNSDLDLTDRQRRLTAVVLATASNDNSATLPLVDLVPYDREAIITRLWNNLWDGNAVAFAQAISPQAANDLEVAKARAALILRGL